MLLKVLWLAQAGRCLARELSYKVGEDESLEDMLGWGHTITFCTAALKGMCFTYIFMQLAIASSVGNVVRAMAATVLPAPSPIVCGTISKLPGGGGAQWLSV